MMIEFSGSCRGGGVFLSVQVWPAMAGEGGPRKGSDVVNGMFTIIHRWLTTSA